MDKEVSRLRRRARLVMLQLVVSVVVLIAAGALLTAVVSAATGWHTVTSAFVVGLLIVGVLAEVCRLPW